MKKLSFILPISTFLLLNENVYANNTEQNCPQGIVCTNDIKVLSANRMEQSPDKVGSSVTVLTKETLEKRGDVSVADALKRVVGITLSRSGGIGSTSNIRLRGTDSGQTKVLIDGISVGDVTDVSNSYDFDTLMVCDIDRIEILRGPQSALYGSDAIGGVINILTNSPQNRNKATAFVEGGSYGTVQGGTGFNVGDDKLYYGANVQHFKTDGFSRAKAGKELDSTKTTSFKANIGSNITDNFKLDFNGGYKKSKGEYDGFPPPNYSLNDAENVVDKDFFYGQTQAELWLFEDIFKSTFKLGGNITNRVFDEPQGFFTTATYDGDRLQASYQGDIFVRDRDVLTFGTEFLEDSAYTTNTSFGLTAIGIDKSVSNQSIFGQYMLGLGENATFTLGARRDSHETFGIHGTYRATAAYNITQTNTIMRGSIGTGFKAPSLYQLYAPFYGTASLQPEKSLGYDIGIEQNFLNDKVTFNITAFQNHLDNLIDFDFGTFTYLNIKEAKTKGIETELNINATDDLNLNAGYTYTLAEDETTNIFLLRRPRHMATFGIDYDIMNNARIGLLGRYVGKQYDTGNQKIRPFFTADMRAEYDLNKNFTLYTRADNILDRDYVEVTGYNTPGFSLFGGIRAKTDLLK
jgi:vitamin B12 transporter